MKTKLLFPYRFKKVGWILLVPSTILGILCIFYDFSFDFLDVKVFAIFSDDFFGSDTVFGLGKNNITDEIVGVLFIIGALFVAFSKEKNEDEFIEKTRWESLVWATYINYFILIFCFLFFYNTSFLWVMIFNMFTILIFFILRFYFIIIMLKKSLGHEK
jgi:FlaA1/EpsC-like NDP-sugar epimerase